MSLAELEAREVAFEQPTGGLWADAWRRLRGNPSFLVGCFFVLAFVVVAIFAPLMTDLSPTEQITTDGTIAIRRLSVVRTDAGVVSVVMLSPSASHPFHPRPEQARLPTPGRTSL